MANPKKGGGKVEEKGGVEGGKRGASGSNPGTP